MEHSFAIDNHAAERYVMGELHETERDAYEEHFFSCSACAHEVESASEFIDVARQVIQDGLKAQIYSHAAKRSIRGSWLNWRSMLQPMPAMACLLLLATAGFTGYQERVVIPRLNQEASAQLVTKDSVGFQLRNARDAGNVITVAKNQRFTVAFDVPPSNYSSYGVTVLTQANAEKLSFKNITKQDAVNGLTIAFAPGKLEPGNYSLLIEGADGSGKKGEVERFSFVFKYAD